MRKIILITGASSNLGRVIAESLDARDYGVYGGYFVHKPKFSSNSVTAIKLDVTDHASIRNAVSMILKKEKRIDILINCAGISFAAKFEDSTEEDFKKLLDVNTLGVFRVIKEVLPVMKKQKFGRIINISSMSGLLAFPNFSIYSASKFALEAFTTSFRYEVIKDNIWVTNIEPGAIKNESNKVVKMPHLTFREKFPIFSWLAPLTKTKDVSSVVLNLIELEKPPVNVLVGNDVKAVYFLKKITPSFIYDKLLQFIWAK